MGDVGKIDADIFTSKERMKFGNMLNDDVLVRLDAANRRDTEMWGQVQSKADWEKFCKNRIKALRLSLGRFPPIPKNLHVNVTSKLKGDGFSVENLVFESRSGLVVTANLYLPYPPRQKMPGILICHSHHYPKTQVELQNMGMTWARQGALVLIMDQIGYGERRQHPFGAITRVPSQISEDYYSRYFLGMQLYLVGESLMGWMVHDIICGVDLLLNRPEIDPEKIILIGSVAGGGDSTAVAAALDSRITCAIPFMFGGLSSGGSMLPYPEDSEAENLMLSNKRFNPRLFTLTGSGEWDSTRCLRLSARDGFLPWVIVGSVAPRYLIYAREFNWDPKRDPAWTRLQEVFAFYNASMHLGFVHGVGTVLQQPPKATHCNNVGPPHRKMIYPLLYSWLAIPIPQEEYKNPVSPENLACLTTEAKMKLKPVSIHELAAEIGKVLTVTARKELEHLSQSDQRSKLRKDWGRLLGDVEPKGDLKVQVHEKKQMGNMLIQKVVLEVERGIVVPTLLLLPTNNGGNARSPVVIAISQEGKQQFLKERAKEIDDLLKSGVAVCLPDLRGTGESRLNDRHGRESEETAISASELMLGQTLLGSRLRDLRATLRYLRKRSDVDMARMALWGDSFAPPNPQGFCDLPQSSDVPFPQSEPLGALLALFGALFEEDVRAVAARRGLLGYGSLLSSHFCYVPYDVIVPGALTAGDLCDVAAALAPRPLRLEGMVDGRNCQVEESEIIRWYEPTLKRYDAHPKVLKIASYIIDDVAAWLVKTLKQ